MIELVSAAQPGVTLRLVAEGDGVMADGETPFTAEKRFPGSVVTLVAGIVEWG
jgi:hypothetical protein